VALGTMMDVPPDALTDAVQNLCSGLRLGSAQERDLICKVLSIVAMQHNRFWKYGGDVLSNKRQSKRVALTPKSRILQAERSTTIDQRLFQPDEYE